MIRRRPRSAVRTAPVRPPWTPASAWGPTGLVGAVVIVADANTDESWAREPGRRIRVLALVESGLVTLAVRARREE